MEEQRDLAEAGARSVHLAALSGQDHSDAARDVGGVDPIDGNHLLSAARASISAVCTCAFLLGVASHLHDESLRRKGRSRRSNGAGNGETVAAVYDRRIELDSALAARRYRRKCSSASRTPAPCGRLAT